MSPSPGNIQESGAAPTCFDRCSLSGPATFGGTATRRRPASVFGGPITGELFDTAVHVRSIAMMPCNGSTSRRWRPRISPCLSWHHAARRSASFHRSGVDSIAAANSSHGCRWPLNRLWKLRPGDELTLERVEMDAQICRHIQPRPSSTEPRPSSPDNGSSTLRSDVHHCLRFKSW